MLDVTKKVGWNIIKLSGGRGLKASSKTEGIRVIRTVTPHKIIVKCCVNHAQLELRPKGIWINDD